MPYEDISIAHVLNYWLADGFDASEQTDVLEWLGEGKTLADMLGEEASASFYTPQRRQEITAFTQYLGINELQFYLNAQDNKSAVLLRTTSDGEFMFAAGNPEGTPAISTDWFARNRESVIR